MNLDEVLLLIREYRAGLETEMVLLRRLKALSTQQGAAARTDDTDALTALTAERDRVMASFVAIEHGLKPMRVELAGCRHVFGTVPQFQEVVAQHREAAALVAGLMSSDGDALTALKEAEIARQFTAHALEQGESTLAAYRRVVAPPPTGANLVDRKG